MKKNATRKALFTSVLALVVCLSMLMGTTFAWFTDSAASANNIIQPGNLDVKLEYWDGDSYEEVTPTQKLFDDNALWEPGHVEVAYLKVSNAGSLALKYQLNVNVFKETVGKTMAGADLKLSDHLVFGVVDKELTSADDMYSREAARLAVGNAKGLKAYNGETKSLEKGGSDYVALVIYMPTDVGNEANHDGINLPSIEMGVNVMATQYTYEEDSFGPDYDEDAIYTDAIVTNEEELKEALANAKNGAVIGIKGDVTWTTGAGIGSTPFIAPVTRATTAKSITLLGLEEGATFTATGAGVGAIGIEDGTVTFKNLKIADKSESYAEDSWEYGYLEFRGNTVFENCDIVNAISMDGDSAKFVNCSFNSNKTKEYAVWVSNGTASFENCYFTGFRGLKTHEAYGSEVASITVNNCKFVDITEKPGMAIGTVNAATEIKLTNNEFIGTQAGDQGLYIYETDTDVTTFKFVSENNKVVSTLVSGADELSAAIAAGKTDIALSAGNHTLPTMNGKEGITIEGVEGTVIGGESASTGFGGNFGKNNTYKNLTFTGSNNGVRSSYGNGGPVTFENCTFAGSTYGFHMDESYGGTLTFNNCTFIGFNAFAGDLIKVTFNNCTFLHSGYYGHTNIWSVGEFNNCTFGDKASIGIRESGKIFVNGVEESFHHEYIGTADSLLDFNASIAGGDAWSGQKVILVDDIDLAGKTWTPSSGFGGNFDGNGHTISNLTIEGATSVGFFADVKSSAVIENVIFDNAKVSGTHYVGVVLGGEWNETVNAKIQNVTVQNSVVTCDTDSTNDNGDKAGGICGYAVSLDIKGCTVKDTTIKAYRDFGGIIGYANAGSYHKTVISGNTVENVTLVIDNEVNYKNYTDDAQHDANPVVGEAAANAVVENNIVK